MGGGDSEIFVGGEIVREEWEGEIVRWWWDGGRVRR